MVRGGEEKQKVERSKRRLLHRQGPFSESSVVECMVIEESTSSSEYGQFARLASAATVSAPRAATRSEERRVGKECRL